MQTIFVMVKCELGKAYEVAEEALSVESVSEVYSTSGQYDLLMKCYLDEKTDIGHFVTSKIQTLAGREGHLHDHHLQGVLLKAALAIWVDIDPADDAAFNHWHSREHVQERVGCPAGCAAAGSRASSGRGRYLLFYDAESTAAFESDAYYERLHNPTALSRAIFPKFEIPGAPSARSSGAWATASAPPC